MENKSQTTTSVRSATTSKHHQQIRQSWDLLALTHTFEEVGQLFYADLFQRAPSLKDGLFSEDNLKVRPVALMKKIDFVLKLLLGGKVDELATLLLQLGERHAGYGVVYSHYVMFGEVFNEVLSQCLGEEAFTADVKGAWVEVYRGIEAKLVEGLNSRKGKQVAAAHTVEHSTATKNKRRTSVSSAGEGGGGSARNDSMVFSPNRVNSIIKEARYARPMSPTGSFRVVGNSSSSPPSSMASTARGGGATKDDNAFGTVIVDDSVRSSGSLKRDEGPKGNPNSGGGVSPSTKKEGGVSSTPLSSAQPSPQKESTHRKQTVPPPNQPARTLTRKTQRDYSGDGEFESTPQGAGGATGGSSGSRAAVPRHQESQQPTISDGQRQAPTRQQTTGSPVRRPPTSSTSPQTQPARSGSQQLQQYTHNHTSTPPQRTGSPIRRNTPSGPVRIEITPLVNRSSSAHRRSGSPALSSSMSVTTGAEGFMRSTAGSTSRNVKSVVIDRTTFTPRTTSELTSEVDPEQQRQRTRELRSFTMAPHQPTVRLQPACTAGVYDANQGRPKEHHPTSMDYIPLSAYSTFNTDPAQNKTPNAWTRNTGHTTFDRQGTGADRVEVLVRTERPIGEQALRKQQESCERLSTPKRQSKTPQRHW